MQFKLLILLLLLIVALANIASSQEPNGVYNEDSAQRFITFDDYHPTPDQAGRKNYYAQQMVYPNFEIYPNPEYSTYSTGHSDPYDSYHVGNEYENGIILSKESKNERLLKEYLKKTGREQSKIGELIAALGGNNKGKITKPESQVSGHLEKQLKENITEKPKELHQTNIVQENDNKQIGVQENGGGENISRVQESTRKTEEEQEGMNEGKESGESKKQLKELKEEENLTQSDIDQGKDNKQTAVKENDGSKNISKLQEESTRKTEEGQDGTNDGKGSEESGKQLKENQLEKQDNVTESGIAKEEHNQHIGVQENGGSEHISKEAGSTENRTEEEQKEQNDDGKETVQHQNQQSTTSGSGDNKVISVRRKCSKEKKSSSSSSEEKKPKNKKMEDDNSSEKETKKEKRTSKEERIKDDEQKEEGIEDNQMRVTETNTVPQAEQGLESGDDQKVELKISQTGTQPDVSESEGDSSTALMVISPDSSMSNHQVEEISKSSQEELNTVKVEESQEKAPELENHNDTEINVTITPVPQVSRGPLEESGPNSDDGQNVAVIQANGEEKEGEGYMQADEGIMQADEGIMQADEGYMQADEGIMQAVEGSILNGRNESEQNVSGTEVIEPVITALKIPHLCTSVTPAEQVPEVDEEVILPQPNQMTEQNVKEEEGDHGKVRNEESSYKDNPLKLLKDYCKLNYPVTYVLMMLRPINIDINIINLDRKDLMLSVQENPKIEEKEIFTEEEEEKTAEEHTVTMLIEDLPNSIQSKMGYGGGKKYKKKKPCKKGGKKPGYYGNKKGKYGKSPGIYKKSGIHDSKFESHHRPSIEGNLWSNLDQRNYVILDEDQVNDVGQKVYKLVPVPVREEQEGPNKPYKIVYVPPEQVLEDNIDATSESKENEPTGIVKYILTKKNTDGTVNEMGGYHLPEETESQPGPDLESYNLPYVLLGNIFDKEGNIRSNAIEILKSLGYDSLVAQFYEDDVSGIALEGETIDGSKLQYHLVEHSQGSETIDFSGLQQNVPQITDSIVYRLYSIIDEHFMESSKQSVPPSNEIGHMLPDETSPDHKEPAAKDYYPEPLPHAHHPVGIYSPPEIVPLYRFDHAMNSIQYPGGSPYHQMDIYPPPEIDVVPLYHPDHTMNSVQYQGNSEPHVPLPGIEVLHNFDHRMNRDQYQGGLESHLQNLEPQPFTPHQIDIYPPHGIVFLHNCDHIMNSDQYPGDSESHLQNPQPFPPPEIQVVPLYHSDHTMNGDQYQRNSEPYIHNLELQPYTPHQMGLFPPPEIEVVPLYHPDHTMNSDQYQGDLESHLQNLEPQPFTPHQTDIYPPYEVVFFQNSDHIMNSDQYQENSVPHIHNLEPQPYTPPQVDIYSSPEILHHTDHTMNDDQYQGSFENANEVENALIVRPNSEKTFNDEFNAIIKEKLYQLDDQHPNSVNNLQEEPRHSDDTTYDYDEDSSEENEWTSSGQEQGSYVVLTSDPGRVEPNTERRTFNVGNHGIIREKLVHLNDENLQSLEYDTTSESDEDSYEKNEIVQDHGPYIVVTSNALDAGRLNPNSEGTFSRRYYDNYGDQLDRLEHEPPNSIKNLQGLEYDTSFDSDEDSSEENKSGQEQGSYVVLTSDPGRVEPNTERRTFNVGNHGIIREKLVHLNDENLQSLEYDTTSESDEDSYEKNEFVQDHGPYIVVTSNALDAGRLTSNSEGTFSDRNYGNYRGQLDRLEHDLPNSVKNVQRLSYDTFFDSDEDSFRKNEIVQDHEPYIVVTRNALDPGRLNSNSEETISDRYYGNYGDQLNRLGHEFPNSVKNLQEESRNSDDSTSDYDEDSSEENDFVQDHRPYIVVTSNVIDSGTVKG
uniref:Putative microtubule-associated protein futsch n=1 Tax=Panstrongylus lignarius TaxID=156445 RepID=A0A224XGE6_9HEMI